ncbi:hypothetical protein Tco_1424486 [Tanacetum coccineum]
MSTRSRSGDTFDGLAIIQAQLNNLGKAGAENRPPMLEKSMYNSWQIRMRLYIKGKKNGRMMLASIEEGPLVYVTIEENGVTRLKKYSKVTNEEKLQDDYDV